ncbi:hypothetical protein THAOC_23491, partial [Thalassiosira oceanica]
MPARKLDRVGPLAQADAALIGPVVHLHSPGAQQQGLGALGVARRSGLDDVGMPTPSPLE